jgi:hypothetical protein
MRKSGRKPICSFQTGKKFNVGRLVLFKPARAWQIIKPDSKTESGLQLSQELSKPKFSFPR